ncbi:MAG: EAL domain-containing protein [Muricomes sp.]
MFFAICLSLCFWSLGFSISTSAATWEISFLWRRISAIGWGTIYSLMLHYFLLLTANRNAQKQQAFYAFLYVPAILSVYVFAVSTDISAVQYHLVKTRLGWASMSVDSVWSAFFNIYYVGYVLACLIIILRWKKRNRKNQNIRRQSAIFLITLIVTTILGSFTDVVLSTLYGPVLPQLAPIFNLLPILAIYYSMKRYKLMANPAQKDKINVLNDKTYRKMQYYLGISYLIGGVSSALACYFPNLVNNRESMRTMFYGGVTIFLIGLGILSAQLIRNQKIKEAVILIIMLCSIPVITLQFVEYASITVWVFPLVLIMASLVFNSRKYIASLTTVAVVTQILVWIHAPKGTVHIDEFDYFLRISIILLTFVVGSFVNRTYISKMEENIYQANFQRLVSEISSDFVNINQINMNKKISVLLSKMGRFFLVDRAYIFLVNEQKNIMTRTYEWVDEKIPSGTENMKDISMDEIPRWIEGLSTKKLVYIEDVVSVPEDAFEEKELLIKQGVQSILAIPIEQEGSMLGFIGLDSVTSTKKWSVYHIELLRILSHLVADGLLRVTSEKVIENMAYYDHLTELPNRTLFSERLSQAIHLAKENKRFVGVIFLDLDGFKMVNDTMGHNGGDELLKEISKRISSRLRKSDTVARFGGDEFLVLINNLNDEKDIIKITDVIMTTFGQPFSVYGQQFRVTASAGVAMYPVDGETTESLIKNADIAMYMAKEKGKNQYVQCTSNMREEVKKNVKLSNDLYGAQERNELILYYQPQINIYTGKIVGLEALLRWNHPKFGMILPNDFISLSEINGTINKIGKWVLETAINQNKKWQDNGFPAVRMAVNLSAMQLHSPALIGTIESILKKSGLDPKYLELEITESAATEDSSHITDVLNQLKQFGISISIDDFGTGYSSLSRIKALPIDRIKIDMQFVQGIEGSEKDQAITKIIINLAKSLNLEVLAEGVESASQLDFLNQKMCDEVQGYYYYKPMPAEEIGELFRKINLKNEI